MEVWFPNLKILFFFLLYNTFNIYYFSNYNYIRNDIQVAFGLLGLEMFQKVERNIKEWIWAYVRNNTSYLEQFFLAIRYSFCCTVSSLMFVFLIVAFDIFIMQCLNMNSLVTVKIRYFLI